MGHGFFELAFTPAVLAQQERYGSRAGYERAADPGDGPVALTRQEADFLAERDSFYLASVSETGWPYVQHRGGPEGFLRALGPTTVGWADVRGNRQYVSVGNASVNDRVALIAMDYPARARLKIMGRLTAHEAADRPDLVAALTVPGLRGRVERAMVVEVAAFDWNCPAYITPRFTVAQVEAAMAPLHKRIAELEARGA